MNDNLKAKIAGKLDNMTDEMGRQLLDYVEFLESKYNRSRRAPSTVQRITENIEDRLGSVRLADVAAKGGAQVMDAAGKLMEGLAAASRVVAEELEPQEPAASGDGGEPAEDDQPPAASEASDDETSTPA
jgi:hypothetical protein